LHPKLRRQGANWASFAANEEEKRRDIVTFKRLAKLAEGYPDLVRRTPVVYMWNTDGVYAGPWYKDVVFDVSGSASRSR
jgi:hypothetical protein